MRKMILSLILVPFVMSTACGKKSLPSNKTGVIKGPGVSGDNNPGQMFAVRDNQSAVSDYIDQGVVQKFTSNNATGRTYAITRLFLHPSGAGKGTYSLLLDVYLTCNDGPHDSSTSGQTQVLVASSLITDGAFTTKAGVTTLQDLKGQDFAQLSTVPASKDGKTKAYGDLNIISKTFTYPKLNRYRVYARKSGVTEVSIKDPIYSGATDYQAALKAALGDANNAATCAKVTNSPPASATPRDAVDISGTTSSLLSPSNPIQDIETPQGNPDDA